MELNRLQISTELIDFEGSGRGLMAVTSSYFHVKSKESREIPHSG
jgi:hypothetical protein